MGGAAGCADGAVDVLHRGEDEGGEGGVGVDLVAYGNVAERDVGVLEDVGADPVCGGVGAVGEVAELVVADAKHEADAGVG